MTDTIVRCDLCLLFEPRPHTHQNDGICRRHAPKPVLAAWQTIDPTVVWPRVTISDYCGDGVPSETAEFPPPEDETFLGIPTEKLRGE